MLQKYFLFTLLLVVFIFAYSTKNEVYKFSTPNNELTNEINNLVDKPAFQKAKKLSSKTTFEAGFFEYLSKKLF